DRSIEHLACGPEREDGTFAVAGIGEPADADLPRPIPDRGAKRLLAEAGDDDGVVDARAPETLEQPHDEALPPDLDETLRTPARHGEQALADAGGQEDGGHDPSTAPSASRKRSKSTGARCPMFATRKISAASRPCPS